MSIDSVRARNWCFTLNNFTQKEYDEAEELGARASYIVVGKEHLTNGTPHLQGYVEFPNGIRGSAIRKLFNARAHWEVRKGTAQQASEYCKKEPGFFEMGKLSQQGRRTDLEEVGAAIVAGSSIREVASSFPGTFIKYHKGISALKAALYEHRTVKPTVIWRWGATGTGKSRGARDAHRSYYIKDGTPWWDGYEQQEAIIIDDFDGKWPYRDLLRLLDHGPYQGQFKGGYVPVNSPTIYITCEYPPDKAFHNADGDISQVLRRIDSILEIKAPVVIFKFEDCPNGGSVQHCECTWCTRPTADTERKAFFK